MGSAHHLFLLVHKNASGVPNNIKTVREIFLLKALYFSFEIMWDVTGHPTILHLSMLENLAQKIEHENEKHQQADDWNVYICDAVRNV